MAHGSDQLDASRAGAQHFPRRRKSAMQISSEELAGGITRVALDGRMDIAGAAVVDLKMNLIAGSAKKLLIDLQKVVFLGSMGLRSIVIPTRAPSTAAAARSSCLRPTRWWNRFSRPAASIP